MNTQGTEMNGLADAGMLRDSFRESMRRLAGGVSVITTGEAEGRTGLTVTSLTALSMEPPSLMFCINRSASALPVLLESRSFGVNIVGSRHEAIADRFTGRDGTRGAARYAGGDWIQLRSGAPILSDAFVAIDCQVDEVLERHSHCIVIGRVIDVRLGEGEDVLCYWERGFHTMARAVHGQT